MRVAVVGSRHIYIDIDKYIPAHATTIISGGARGVDTLAEAYADKHNLVKIIFKPEYDKYGKSAPIVRNRLIVENADMVVAIWDGHSRGTKFTIDYARKLNKPIRVFTVDLEKGDFT